MHLQRLIVNTTRAVIDSFGYYCILGLWRSAWHLVGAVIFLPHEQINSLGCLEISQSDFTLKCDLFDTL